MHGALTATAEHLSEFGGHDAAAGLSLPPDNLDAFTDALIQHANTHISEEQLTPTVRIDCDTLMPELELEVVRRIESLHPFGRGNPRPTLRLREATVAEAPRQMGSDEPRCTSDEDAIRDHHTCFFATTATAYPPLPGINTSSEENALTNG